MEREQATTFMNSLLAMMVQKKASDLFLTADSRPRSRSTARSSRYPRPS